MKKSKGVMLLITGIVMLGGCRRSVYVPSGPAFPVNQTGTTGTYEGAPSDAPPGAYDGTSAGSSRMNGMSSYNSTYPYVHHTSVISLPGRPGYSYFPGWGAGWSSSSEVDHSVSTHSTASVSRGGFGSHGSGASE